MTCKTCNEHQEAKKKLAEAIKAASDAMNAARSALAAIEWRAGNLERAATAAGSERCNKENAL
jgi:argininosuccinate lyase